MTRRIGRYELVAPLGRGAMGEVWEALLVGPEGFRKPCALKLLRVPGGRNRRLLASEARLGALLSHPNVLSTLELGWADGTWFVAMELVRGASLTQLLRDGPLEAGAVVDVGVQACAGLAHIHGMGLLHRDIKPGNLLVDRSGLLKIADLGIARLASETPLSGAGTPGYMPPEQFDGGEDHRADLFALGVVLYALVTGRSPLSRSLAGALEVEVLLEDPAFLAPLDAAVAGLGDVVRRCLRFEPEDRWRSAGAMAAALRALRLPGGRRGLLARLLTLRPELDGDDELPTEAPTTIAEVGSLPPRRDPFVGREAEAKDLRARIDAGPGLVTVAGPGGMGKTRLAVEVAWATRMPGGAWFCPLEAATSVDELCGGVASVLGVPLAEGDPVDQVGLALRGHGRLLLVLDNLEQAVGAAAAVVPRWLGLAPEATVVTTSRIALRLAGEDLVSLGPLSLDEASALFVARAPRPGDLADVRVLVERLDGMPLAIELAAARTRLLTVPAILRRLDDRFRLLAGGGPDRPERQRSLRASLDGSWDLLDAQARATLAQLSVFVGGFTLEAADAVVDLDGGWVLDPLATLVDHSLVRRTSDDRFGLLVAVAAYAAEQLAPEARAAAEARHGAFFASLGSRDTLDLLHGRGGLEPLQAMGRDLDNLIAAATRTRDPGAALAAYQVLRLRGPFDLARTLLQDALPGPRSVELRLALAELTTRSDPAGAEAHACVALAEAEDPLLRGSALYRLGVLATDTARPDEADGRLREAIAAFRAVGDEGRAGSALAALATAQRRAGHVLRARELYQEGLAAIRRSGSRVAEAVVRANLASVVHDLGDPDEATRLLETALAAHRQLGNPRHEALVLNGLAGIHADQGRADEAFAFYRSAVALQRRLGNRADLGLALGNLGIHHREQGQIDDAVACIEQALALHRELSSVLPEAVATGTLGLLHEDAGRPAEALACFDRAIALATEAAAPVWVAIQRGYRGRLHLEQGDLDAAAADLDAAVSGTRDRHLPAWASFLADVAVVRARRSDAIGAREASTAAEAYPHW